MAKEAFGLNPAVAILGLAHSSPRFLPSVGTLEQGYLPSLSEADMDMTDLTRLLLPSRLLVWAKYRIVDEWLVERCRMAEDNSMSGGRGDLTELVLATGSRGFERVIWGRLDVDVAADEVVGVDSKEM